MSNWLRATGIGGSIVALIALVIVLVKSLIALVGTIMFAVKALIVLAFIVLFLAVAVAIFRTWSKNQKRKGNE
jgi:hypothetical protein